MNILEIILLPFIFIYKGFLSIILFPYNIIKKIIKKDNTKTTLAEAKNNEQVKVVNTKPDVSNTSMENANSAPNTLNSSSELSFSSEKEKRNFEKLVKKAREEEERRIKEQEKLRLDSIKKEELKQKKEAEEQKKEDARIALEEERIKNLKAKGEPVTFDEKVKSFFKKLTKNKNEEIELAAKKKVLSEQFKSQKNDDARFKEAILFQYVAKNKNGEIEKNTIEATSRVDVHSFLLAEGYDVYEITPAKAPINITTYRMKKNRLIFYLSQLSAYLKSGIALSDAVKILDDQAKNLNEKKAWRAVYYDLSMGDVLSSAMAKRKDTFPKLLVNMIKTAEMTGNLPETLDDMVDYYTESEATKRQMKQAMTYPIIVTIFAVVVITFILLYVVPQFQGIYENLGSDIPAITKFVVSISDFLKNYLLYILVGIVILILLYMYLFRNNKSFRRTMQEFFMHVPVFGNIIIYNEVTIFTKTFANLLNHNVFITDSMDVLSKITENEIYKRLIYTTAKNLTKGNTISSAFKDHWAFPNIAYQMLITGEKTGRLGPMMERVSNYYQEQHKALINQMKSLIEPIMIVTLAVIVGGILLAVIIPMYGMYDSL